MSDRTVDVILPAAGRIDGAFAAEASARVKALIEFNGETVLERLIGALRASGRIRRLVVIGPTAVAAHALRHSVDAVLSEGASGPDNILRGLEWLQKGDGARAERVMIATTDLALLTPPMVCQFLDRCNDAELCVPAIRREDFLQRFPGTPDHYVRMRDGAWTLGCAFLVEPRALLASRPHLERAFAARKNHVAMARLLGLAFVARLLTRQLTLHHLVAQCERLIGCAGAAVLGCAPELAFDIDDVEDYRYVKRLLENAHAPP